MKKDVIKKPSGRPSVWKSMAKESLMLSVPWIVKTAWKNREFSNAMKLYIEAEAEKYLRHFKRR